MARVLNRNKDSVLLKVSIQEFSRISEANLIDEEEVTEYEFIFDTPQSAKELLKTF